MNYSYWLAGFSVLFVLLELIWPLHKQKLFRHGIWNDLLYLIFNGHYLGVLVGGSLSFLIQSIPAVNAMLDFHFMKNIPAAVQFLLLLVMFDFLQWCIHNLLHRVPVLWEFHKVHHSIEELDWIGNWRFHAFEVFLYQLLLYPFAAVMRFDVSAMFWYGALSTFIGHFAHANVRFRIGPLRYILNSPEMHAWHHVHPEAGPVNKNFGITLSIWDWVFRTAYVPDGQSPGRLGFGGIEQFPATIAGHFVVPVLKEKTPDFL